MSKAFTRESDEPSGAPIVPRPPSLPPGAKNYLTARGEQGLRAELDRLLNIERPRIAASGAGAFDSLAALDQRILQLRQSLDSAVVVPSPAPPWEQVRFGATVTIRERDGEVSSYRLVGVDELDLDRNWISWLSPLAKALLNTRPGQHVRLKSPAGERELEILGITYE